MSLSPDTPILLRTSQRDIRIARGRYSGLRLSPATGATRFAQNCIRRYNGRVWQQPDNAFLFRRQRIGASIQYSHQTVNTYSAAYNESLQHTNISPHQSMTVLVWGSQPRDEKIQTQPIPQLRYLTETQTLKNIIVRKETNIIEQLAEQLVVRKTRVEVRSETDTAQSLPSPAPAAKRIFRHLESPALDPSTIKREIEQNVIEKFQENKTTPVFQSTPQTSVDINTLADQVIRQIDQRILAQRERLGKV